MTEALPDRERAQVSETTSAPPVNAPPEPRPSRLLSLDAFRGLTIAGMLLVNNMALDAATPRTLTHADWNAGVHFADLVFPWFLFIVGVALPYSADAYVEKRITCGSTSLAASDEPPR